MNGNDIALLLLGLFMTTAIGIAAWALKEVVRLRGDHEGLKARTLAESEATNRRLIDFGEGMKHLTRKMDKLLMKVVGNTD